MEKNIFELQGNSHEAFYQLGLLEKKRPSSAQVIKKMVLKNKHLSFLSEKIFGNTLSLPSFLKDEIHQYIEGKGISSDEFIQNFYLPDLLSSINSAFPKSVPNIGCSSALINDGESIKHSRILDYPLGPYAEKYTSDLLFKLEGLNKTFALSFTDIPLPCLTSFNDKGISLALHQRTSNKANFKGSSILELTSEISLKAKSLDESIDLAKNFNAINNWSIILVSSNEKAGVEIETVPSGTLKIKKYDLSGNNFYYICNKSLEEKNNDKSFGDNWDFYNDKRTEWVNQQKIDEKSENFFSLPKVVKKTPFSHYPITPASIQSTEINLTKRSVRKISNSNVKFNDGYEEKYTLDWSKSIYKFDKQQTRQRKKAPLESFYEAISKCQYYWDQGDRNKSFHFAQLCLDLSPTNHLKSISTVFYSYFVFCEVQNKKILSGQYEKLLNVYSSTPEFLKSDCLLIINYYAHYLGYPSFEVDKLEKIHFEFLQKNKKLPKFILKRIFKYLYISRFELFSFGKINYLIDAVGSP